jgi:hypothetical protein
MKISSQKHIDQEIVDQKIADGDYTVTVATISDEYQLVIDGHHSLAAARQAGVSPVYVDSDYNYRAEAESMGLEAFLESKYIDSDYYDIETGNNVW